MKYEVGFNEQIDLVRGEVYRLAVPGGWLYYDWAYPNEKSRGHAVFSQLIPDPNVSELLPSEN